MKVKLKNRRDNEVLLNVILNTEDSVKKKIRTKT